MWNGGTEFETSCRTCGKQIRMLKDPHTHCWHPVEIATGNRHICMSGTASPVSYAEPSRSRYRQLLEKDFLTPAEEKEYEAICMSMLKKGHGGKK